MLGFCDSVRLGGHRTLPGTQTVALRGHPYGGPLQARFTSGFVYSDSYEPRGVVYQWSNPGPRPLVYLVFNVNPKNLPPVVEIEDRPTGPFSTDPHITWAICCIGPSTMLILIVCTTQSTIVATPGSVLRAAAPSPSRRIDPLAAHRADDQVVRPDLDEAFNAGPAPLVSAVRVAVPPRSHWISSSSTTRTPRQAPSVSRRISLRDGRRAHCSLTRSSFSTTSA